MSWNSCCWLPTLSLSVLFLEWGNYSWGWLEHFFVFPQLFPNKRMFLQKIPSLYSWLYVLGWLRYQVIYISVINTCNCKFSTELAQKNNESFLHVPQSDVKKQTYFWKITSSRLCPLYTIHDWSLSLKSSITRANNSAGMAAISLMIVFI